MHPVNQRPINRAKREKPVWASFRHNQATMTDTIDATPYKEGEKQTLLETAPGRKVVGAKLREPTSPYALKPLFMGFYLLFAFATSGACSLSRSTCSLDHDGHSFALFF
jgi:hypothetical protein